MRMSWSPHATKMKAGNDFSSFSQNPCEAACEEEPQRHSCTYIYTNISWHHVNMDGRLPDPPWWRGDSNWILISCQLHRVVSGWKMMVMRMVVMVMVMMSTLYISQNPWLKLHIISGMEKSLSPNIAISMFWWVYYEIDPADPQILFIFFSWHTQKGM